VARDSYLSVFFKKKNSATPLRRLVGSLGSRDAGANYDDVRVGRESDLPMIG